MPHQSRSGPSDSQDTKRSQRPLRVLVVDAEPKVRGQLARCVERASMSLSQAGSLAEARERLASEPVDLVLVEANLPDGSGVTLAEEIQRSQPVTQTILLAAQPDLSSAIAAIRVGAADFITKPLNMDEVKQRLAQAAARCRSQRNMHRRIKRLKRVCHKLTKARDEVSQQVDILCNDLVTAYQELANQMNQVVQGGEFAGVIRGELDLEVMLRKTLDYLLKQAGPTNAALFLPSNGDEYSLGGYINYTCGADAADLLLDHLADTVAPRIAEQLDDVLHLTTNEQLQDWVGDDAAYLADSHVIAFSCPHENEALAVVILFRDNGEPFASELLEVCTTIAPLLGAALAKLIRVHHRHMAEPGEDDTGGPWDAVA